MHAKSKSLLALACACASLSVNGITIQAPVGIGIDPAIDHAKLVTGYPGISLVWLDLPAADIVGDVYTYTANVQTPGWAEFSARLTAMETIDDFLSFYEYKANDKYIVDSGFSLREFGFPITIEEVKFVGTVGATDGAFFLTGEFGPPMPRNVPEWTVPDSGSSFAMASIGLLALTGLRRRH